MREADFDHLVASAAEQGGTLVRVGEGKSFLDREIEKHIRTFNAASLELWQNRADLLCH